MIVTPSLLFKYICFKNESTAGLGTGVVMSENEIEIRDMAKIIKVVPLQMTEFGGTLKWDRSPILQMGKHAER